MCNHYVIIRRPGPSARRRGPSRRGRRGGPSYRRIHGGPWSRRHHYGVHEKIELGTRAKIQQELGHGGAAIGPRFRRERQQRVLSITRIFMKGFIYERIAAVREPRPHRVDIPFLHGFSDCPGDIRIHLRRRAVRALARLQLAMLMMIQDGIYANRSKPQKSDSANRSLENRQAR